MINTLFQVSGLSYSPINIDVNKSISEFSTSSKFTANFDSPFGRHSTDFNIGNEVKIFADKDTDPAVTNIFTGILENRSFEGEGNSQNLVLSGRDYTARLMDVTIEPVVYTNSEISTIVTNIINNEVKDITTNNVDVTTTTLERIAFNHTSVYEAFKQLAELSGFMFYIDNDKDLHFEIRNSISSGFTFNNTNILNSNFETNREDFSNIIWVYGDRQLTTAPREIFTQTASLGSVITLNYKPSNTNVSVLGSIYKGGIFNLVAGTSVSGLDYLVNYEDRQIIFVSGTTVGYSKILPNTGSAVIVYERSVPIVKFGQDDASITAFGPKEKVIIDKSIKDPLTARKLLLSELENSLPLDRVNLQLNGWFALTPGNTCIVNIPNFNLNKTVGILDVGYEFNPSNVRSENVISVGLDNKMGDLTDQISDLNRRLKKIEALDADDSDLITRLHFSIGSVIAVGSRWNVLTNAVVGSVAHLYATNFTPPVFPFNLASGTGQGNLAGSFTGSAVAFTALSVIISGGYSY